MSRILVAEDDEAVREFVSRALTVQGHEVTAVDDGGDALEALDARSYDLLLTDIVMPSLDGIALALKAVDAYPGMGILLMTGYAAEQQRARDQQSLACRVISKPFSLKEICATVSDTLRKGPRGLSRSMA